MALRWAILLISCSTLGFEILLTRLMAIIQWHHLAFWIISLALLGYGASGTFLTLFQRYLLPHWHGTLFILSVLLGFSFLFCFHGAQRVSFHPLEFLWDPGEIFQVLSISLWLFVPFFLAGTAVGLALTRFPEQISSLYRFDLIGAGLGAGLVLLFLHLFYPTMVLRVLTVFPWMAALLLAVSLKGARWLGGAIPFAALLFTFLFWPTSWDRLHLSEYKSLSKVLLLPESKILRKRSGPLGLLTVVESPSIPFRQAPGLSPMSAYDVPKQLGLFVDGEGPSPLNRFMGDLKTQAYLSDLTSALPYSLLQHPEVLIPGGGTGENLLQALSHGARFIQVVEANPQILNLVKEDLAFFTGNPFQMQPVHVAIGQPREYLAGNKETKKKFDLIQISLLDAPSPSSMELNALKETYLYTVEAVKDYLQSLNPGGYLAITRWLDLPPRDALKLIATLRQALEETGVPHPEHHLLAIRSWNTVTLLLKKSAVTPQEISRLKNFSEARGFDLVYYPGMNPGEANRFNILEEDYFSQGAVALLGPHAEQFLRENKFNLEPARDDRPFFHDYLKWRTIPELFRLRSQGGLPLMDWGLPVLSAVLILLSLVSFILILLPLRWLKKQFPVKGLWAVLVYFTALGLAFLFIEISALQRFILYLGHPTYAAACVLSGFLVFAGLGSGFSQRWQLSEKKLLLLILVLISVGTLLIVTLPWFLHKTLALPWTLKVILSWMSIAPLAFLMGMPFPMGLSFLRQTQSGAIPWAWGINGYASVLSAPLATLLALHLGFRWVWIFALLLYLVAGISFVGFKRIGR